MSLDVDKIDTHIRHAMGIVDLIMDNIGNRVDSDQDSMEYALWAAKKHLEGAVNEISGDGEKRMAEILADLDDNPFEDDEGEDEEAEEASDISRPARERVELFLQPDGRIAAMKGHYK